MNKVQLLIFCLFLSLIYPSCSQNLEQKIIGEWGISMMQESNGQKYLVDCPDFILFRSDGSYQVTNDCEMSGDNKIGLYEKGKWNSDETQYTITLFEREFLNKEISEHMYYSRHDNLVLVVDYIDTNGLRLCVDDGYECTMVTYEVYKD